MPDENKDEIRKIKRRGDPGNLSAEDIKKAVSDGVEEGGAKMSEAQRKFNKQIADDQKKGFENILKDTLQTTTKQELATIKVLEQMVKDNQYGISQRSKEGKEQLTELRKARKQAEKDSVEERATLGFAFAKQTKELGGKIAQGTETTAKNLGGDSPFVNTLVGFTFQQFRQWKEALKARAKALEEQRRKEAEERRRIEEMLAQQRQMEDSVVSSVDDVVKEAEESKKAAARRGTMTTKTYLKKYHEDMVANKKKEESDIKKIELAEKTAQTEADKLALDKKVAYSDEEKQKKDVRTSRQEKAKKEEMDMSVSDMRAAEAEDISGKIDDLNDTSTQNMEQSADIYDRLFSNQWVKLGQMFFQLYKAQSDQRYQMSAMLRADQQRAFRADQREAAYNMEITSRLDDIIGLLGGTTTATGFAAGYRDLYDDDLQALHLTLFERASRWMEERIFGKREWEDPDTVVYKRGITDGLTIAGEKIAMDDIGGPYDPLEPGRDAPDGKQKSLLVKIQESLVGLNMHLYKNKEVQESFAARTDAAEEVREERRETKEWREEVVDLLRRQTEPEKGKDKKNGFWGWLLAGLSGIMAKFGKMLMQPVGWVVKTFRALIYRPLNFMRKTMVAVTKGFRNMLKFVLKPFGAIGKWFKQTKFGQLLRRWSIQLRWMARTFKNTRFFQVLNKGLVTVGKALKTLFGKGGTITRMLAPASKFLGIAGKLVGWPITVGLAIYGAIKGGIDELRKGSGVWNIMKGMLKGAFEETVGTIMDLIFDGLGWVVGKLGFSETAEKLKGLEWTEIWFDTIGLILKTLAKMLVGAHNVVMGWTGADKYAVISDPSAAAGFRVVKERSQSELDAEIGAKRADMANQETALHQIDEQRRSYRRGSQERKALYKIQQKLYASWEDNRKDLEFLEGLAGTNAIKGKSKWASYGPGGVGGADYVRGAENIKKYVRGWQQGGVFGATAAVTGQGPQKVHQASMLPFGNIFTSGPRRNVAHAMGSSPMSSVLNMSGWDMQSDPRNNQRISRFAKLLYDHRAFGDFNRLSEQDLYAIHFFGKSGWLNRRNNSESIYKEDGSFRYASDKRVVTANPFLAQAKTRGDLVRMMNERWTNKTGGGGIIHKADIMRAIQTNDFSRLNDYLSRVELVESSGEP